MPALHLLLHPAGTSLQGRWPWDLQPHGVTVGVIEIMMEVEEQSAN